ncbi:MAG: hypothetical protein ISQ64_03205 [SAR86 cluster bacterium]|jgi:hypothetical protein|uniref:Glycoside hydrolase family 2 catalytic domain-containing protein n=1 Tax=SAR86 cluster bacterium TaxID=2030880 RepID=A0A937LJX9_9GAMM|nr:hypothetical protein [SAR86 cluster bacterium]MDA0976109.1 hypothetical protein [Pseudomonadota bacterium]MDA1036876.1 hypothetical protein [Pseudomonadota bacterium]
MKKSFLLSLIILSINSYGIEVKIENNTMVVNGESFYMKGICYHPVKIGKTKRSFDNLDDDIILMKEAGINTIRVYEPIDDINVLDKLGNAGIKVVISFGYNQKGKFDIVSGTFINYVRKYKNHEAILMWELGNEYNYNPQWFGGDIKNWYKAMELVSQIIQIEDPDRLVSSAHGDLPSKDALNIASSIQVWGMNVYRWDKPASIFSEWQAISDKPMYFAELGADSYMTKATNKYTKGINEQAQADANEIILNEVLSNYDKNIGSFVFQFTDGLWKAGNPSKQDTGGSAPNSDGTPYDGTANEEYWGIVDINRNKKITFDVIKNAYVDFDIN